MTDLIPLNFLRQNLLALIGIFLLFVTGGFLLTSCGKKEVKPVSEESKLAQEAFELSETLKKAYLRNDRKTLEENSTLDGYRELLGAMKSFDSAELIFTPTWLQIEDSAVYLTVSWRGTWRVWGKEKEDRGIAVFVLEGKSLKLSQIQRSNPFSQPE